MKKRLFLLLVLLLAVVAGSYYHILKDSIKAKLFPLKSCDESESCVRFCCHDNEACTSKIDFNISVRPGAEALRPGYSVLKGSPCEEFHLHEDFHFEENGFLVDDHNFTYHWNEYCIYEDDDNSIAALTCAPVDISENAKHVYPWLMLFSLPFLLVTLGIFIGKKMRFWHGKCIMSYMISLTFMYFFLGIIGLYNHRMLEEHNRTCKTFGYLFLVFIFMCFFWLNVMCYDAWRTIRASEVLVTNSKKFTKYCIYAFGVPSLLVLFIVFLNELEIIPEEWRTGIGNYSCAIAEPIGDVSEEVFTNNRNIQFLYLYGPILLFLIINVAFYVAAAYNFVKLRKRMSNFGTSVKRTFARFQLYVLFCALMTLAWSIEILSWYFHDNAILELICIVNCLQGFVIFIVFVVRFESDREMIREMDQVELVTTGTGAQ